MVCEVEFFAVACLALKDALSSTFPFDGQLFPMSLHSRSTSKQHHAL
jgi:hypothetical protein